MKRRAALVIPAVVALLIGVPPQSALAADGGRATYYLDCERGSDDAPGTSPGRAWRSPAAVNAKAFAPGSTLLLRRGTTCAGTLVIDDSGVSVDAYGVGRKPHVAGGGAESAVRIEQAERVSVRNLEISNTAPDVAKRRGVYLKLTDFGTGHHYRLSHLDIHDVAGDDSKDLNGSAGIQLSAYGSAVPTNFDDVRIEQNTIRRVDRSGINMGSQFNHRPERADPDTTWFPNTRLVIRGNLVDDVGGDGIVVQVSKDALVEHNTVADFQKRSAGYNAGIWAWNADGTVIQFNEAFGGHTTRDGMGFNIDGAQRGTIIQYN